MTFPTANKTMAHLGAAGIARKLTGQTRLPGFKGEWVVKTLFELTKPNACVSRRGD